MVEHTSPYGIGTTVDLPYDRAVARTRDELGREGFGVLTEIDVQATFKNKLDVEFRSPRRSRGACSGCSKLWHGPENAARPSPGW